MFRNYLENLGKSTGKCKNKHSDKFPKFLKIFGNLRKKSENVARCSRQPSGIFNFLKSSEIIGSLRMSSKIFGQFQKIVAMSFQHFSIFLKSLEIFGKNGKMSESSQNDLPTVFENFRKFSAIFGSVRKCSENFGTLGNFSNVIGGSV